MYGFTHLPLSAIIFQPSAYHPTAICCPPTSAPFCHLPFKPLVLLPSLNPLAVIPWSFPVTVFWGHLNHIRNKTPPCHPPTSTSFCHLTFKPLVLLPSLNPLAVFSPSYPVTHKKQRRAKTHQKGFSPLPNLHFYLFHISRFCIIFSEFYYIVW